MKSFVAGRITVGVPTRNRSVLVRRAVESALSQGCADLEVVVSDNASTDDTAERMREIGDPRLVFLRQENDLGMIGNFNACLEKATGEYFLMLSDDDVLEAGALERLSAPFRTPPAGLEAGDIGLTWCRSTITSVEGKALWVSEGGPAVESPASLVAGFLDGLRGPRLCGVLLRTHDALEVGGYDTRYGALCDIGNWMRAGLRYKWAVCLPEPVVRYAMHQSSTTSASMGRDWQKAGENLHQDLVIAAQASGDIGGADRITKRKTIFLTSLIAYVLMQRMGKPGWIGYGFKELLRAPQYLINHHSAARLLREGWKLTRLGKR